MLTENDALSNTFKLLGSIVTEMYSKGRRCVGATLKPHLRYRSYNNFSEQQLGFAKFGDFLRAAERAGAIQLTFTPGGDLEVWPPGVATAQAYSKPRPAFVRTSPLSDPTPSPTWASPSTLTGPVRVRQDLWDAFNSFSVSWVYNRTTDIAYRADRLGAGDDSLISADPNLIQIEAGRERVVGWMKSFANMQGPDTRTRLLASLEGNGSPYHFNNAMGFDRNLRRAWNRYHIQQTLAAIQAWANSNNIKPKDITAPFVPRSLPYWPSSPQQAAPVPTASPGAAPALPAQSAQPTLAPRLLSLIDEMVDELLRLRGTLQVIEPKR